MIYGETNIGKTKICEMVEEIFKCDRLQPGKSHFAVKGSSYNPSAQIVTMDELNVAYYFSRRNLSDMKWFLEGNGITLEEKYGLV